MCSGWLCREIPVASILQSGEAVHAKGVGKLATMMEVMFHHVPDDSAAGQSVDLAFPLILHCRLQIGEGISSQDLLYDLPDLLLSADQFTCRARLAARFGPGGKSSEVRIALLQVIMEPACSHGDNVARQFLNGTQVGRST
jgi:hypothetical protein